MESTKSKSSQLRSRDSEGEAEEPEAQTRMRTRKRNLGKSTILNHGKSLRLRNMTRKRRDLDLPRTSPRQSKSKPSLASRKILGSRQSTNRRRRQGQGDTKSGSETETADEREREWETEDETETEATEVEQQKEKDVYYGRHRQCLALKCIKKAREGSKYCSKKCCIELATDRIHAILPGRIKDWEAHPSVAEEKNRKDLQLHLQTIETLKKRWDQLNETRNVIDKYIECITGEILDVGEVGPDIPEDEGNTHCVSCGSDFPVKSILKHMDKCFHKWENQRCLVSNHKVNIEGPPIFCGFYISSEKTYCCRLKVLCVKHTKTPKLMDGQICGYSRELDALGQDHAHAAEHEQESLSVDQKCHSICRILKLQCHKHFAWEKKHLANIDLQRLHVVTKIDILDYHIKQIQFAMKNRKSVMALLLNHTTVHDPDPDPTTSKTSKPPPQHPLPFTPEFGFGGSGPGPASGHGRGVGMYAIPESGRRLGVGAGSSQSATWESSIANAKNRPLAPPLPRPRWNDFGGNEKEMTKKIRSMINLSKVCGPSFTMAFSKY